MLLEQVVIEGVSVGQVLVAAEGAEKFLLFDLLLFLLFLFYFLLQLFIDLELFIVYHFLGF